MLKIVFVFLLLLIAPTFALAADAVELNTASLAELDLLVGVGPIIAQRIIDGRPYESVNDLSRVKGIGEKTLQKIKNQGLAYVLAEPQTPLIQTAPSAPITQPTAVPTPKPATYPKGIFINEVLPAPEGPDETSEWIELFNENDTQVSLQGWKIKDVKGGTKTYIFPKTATISGKSYILLKRPETKITLNNDEDGLTLFMPNGQVADAINYKEAPKNQSYNKTGASQSAATSGTWSKFLTPGAENIINTIALNQGSAASLLNQEKSDMSNIEAKSVAALHQATAFNQNFSADTNPWLLFIVASIIAIISGAVFLALQLKLFKNHERT